MFATPQKLTFSRAVEDKLKALANEWRKRGMDPEHVIPASLKPHYLAMREMHNRLLRGKSLEYSHAEMVAEQKMAGWMIREWHRLHGTEPPANPWSDG